MYTEVSQQQFEALLDTQRILEKLNAGNSMEAVRYADAHGLLD